MLSGSSMTLIIQIGNSDDKLSQREWSSFILEIDIILEGLVEWGRGTIHFSGHSNPNEFWQNYCWVVEIDEDYLDQVKKSLIGIRSKYRQDSLAWTLGKTEFI